MFIEELYFYYISLKTEFVDFDTYREWLNKAFLADDNKEDILLELQFCTDNTEKTIEEMQIYICNRLNSIDDPWSWNDKEQVEQITEKLIKFYD